MSAAVSPRLSQRSLSQQGSRIRELLHLTEQPQMMSLAGGLPAPEGFPHDLIGAAFERAMRHTGVTGTVALQYAPTEGVAVLREQVAAEHGVTLEQVLVTTGSQQGLDLLARVLCDPGDVVVAEDPSYLGALQAFRFAGAEVVGVAGDADGVDVDGVDEALTRAGSRAKAVYVVPNFHNPSGSVLAADRRARLVAVAQRHGVVIIEDDPYSEIRFDGAPLPSMAGDDRPVVRLGSSSKVLAPGLRVGWLTGHPQIVGAAVRAKQAADLHTPSLNQLLVAEARADAAAFAAHLERARHIYRERAAALVAALRRTVPEARFTDPRGGMFLWARLPVADTEHLLRAAVEHGVAFVPGSAFSVGTPLDDAARLSFATLRPDEMDEACHRLAVAINA